MIPKKMALLIPAALLSQSLAVAAGPTPSIVQERNKQVVLAFYEAGLNQKDFVAAKRFIGPRYIQHNPTASDGVEGFRKFVAFLRQKYSQAHNTIERALADGDLVVLHVHEVLKPGDRGTAIVDIYRLEQGKIVEHWDVKQPVPATAANRNTMF